MILLPLTTTSKDLATLVTEQVDQHGTAVHSYCASADQGDRQSFVQNLVDFADFVHLVTDLHGQLPGLIDHAAVHTVDIEARAWLLSAIDGFAVEREYLNQLCVAVGPVPSTIGHSETSTTVAQQRHALEMLAQSERRGCALATAVTLTLEWHAIRKILDVGALRLGIEPPICKLPNRAETLVLLAELPDPARLYRAFEFGATQLLAQHRGMWDLLCARAAARQTQN